jgi:hypothetical protein
MNRSGLIAGNAAESVVGPLSVGQPWTNSTDVSGITLHGPPESAYECDEHHIRFASVEYRELLNAALRTG